MIRSFVLSTLVFLISNSIYSIRFDVLIKILIKFLTLDPNSNMGIDGCLMRPMKYSNILNLTIWS